MRSRLLRPITGVILTALMASCTPSEAPLLPAPPLHVNGQALWQIVNEHCVPGQRDHGDPAPCAEVSITDGRDRGYVVLKDRNGASQYLVMPTIRVTGIEDARLLRADATDYFTPAWRARQLVAMRLHAALTREDVGIAINSIYGRSQDLLHLHVDCLRADVRDKLHSAAPTIGYHWARQPLVLNGHGFHAVRIDGDDNVATDPFRLLSDGLHVRPEAMGAWTLVLAGMDFADGKPGFVLLAARADPAAGYYGSGEQLQDHSCAGVGSNP